MAPLSPPSPPVGTPSAAVSAATTFISGGEPAAAQFDLDAARTTLMKAAGKARWAGSGIAGSSRPDSPRANRPRNHPVAHRGFGSLDSSTAELIGGTVGGFGQALVGHPFDTLKVRLQTSTRYKGGWDCFKATVRDEGFLGLYKGIYSPLMGNGFCNAVIFGVNGHCRRWVADGAHEDHLTPGQYAKAGAITGFVVAFVNCPFEAVKVKLQTQYSKVTKGGQAGPLYTGVFDCARKLYASRGIAGLYRGISITVLREIPSFAGYFATFEIAKSYMWGDNRERVLTNAEVLFAGGLAGIGAWVPCYMDVVKSRMQSNSTYRNMFDAIRDVWSTSGFRGFWKGIGPTLARAFPANAATFFVYNLVMSRLSPTEELGKRIEFN
ncbi:mitochondrial carrier domain-containing protein [Hyaloraphidium curvatum]|nr:mitochondrial carrier domain-containing protein [Hyaloraphidium curvatum]